VAPNYIAQNDGFVTTIVLDGSASADEIDDPQGTNPLRFHFSFSEPFRVASGGTEQSKVTVLFAGDRPVTATLQVTDVDGMTSNATVTIGITLPR
jgi:hypothetical protein